MSLSKLQETAKDGKAWCAAVPGLQRVRHALQLSNNNRNFSVLSVQISALSLLGAWVSDVLF